MPPQLPAAPPIGGAAAPMSGISDLLAGGVNGRQQAALAQQQQLAALMGRIRDLGATVDQLATEYPVLAGEMQQIQQILKLAVVRAAQAGQMGGDQTPASLAVPGGEGL
jgi:outer membrane murein-binding lipoprotein Lpp